MKKAFSMSLLLATVILGACNKQTGSHTAAPEQSLPTQNQTPIATAQQKFGNPADKHWEDAADDCITPAINCLPEVRIPADAVLGLVGVIESEGTPGDIGEYFLSAEGIALAEEWGIEEDYLELLQGGEYNVLMAPSGSSTDVVYFFFGLAETLTKEGAEYVLPCELY